jgi:hypothetical protein
MRCLSTWILARCWETVPLRFDACFTSVNEIARLSQRLDPALEMIRRSCGLAHVQRNRGHEEGRYGMAPNPLTGSQGTGPLGE